MPFYTKSSSCVTRTNKIMVIGTQLVRIFRENHEFLENVTKSKLYQFDGRVMQDIFDSYCLLDP